MCLSYPKNSVAKISLRNEDNVFSRRVDGFRRKCLGHVYERSVWLATLVTTSNMLRNSKDSRLKLTLTLKLKAANLHYSIASTFQNVSEHKCHILMVIKGIILHKFKCFKSSFHTILKRANHELGYQGIKIQYGKTAVSL